MSTLPPPKYRRLSNRVEEAAAKIAGAEPSIRLQIIVDEGASREEIKAAQKAAIATHLEKHPEARGKEVAWIQWCIRRMVYPKGERPAAYQAAQARDDAPPPPAATPKPDLVSQFDEPALDWRTIHHDEETESARARCRCVK
jgi:hypothetical protein